jgi:hypothetical protein
MDSSPAALGGSGPSTKKVTINPAASLDYFVDRPPQKEFLRSKFQVGSCKSDRRTFPLSQKVFHSGDVPPNVVASKKEVLKSKKPDILCMDRQPWDQKTILDPSRSGPNFNENSNTHTPSWQKRKNLKAELLLVRAGLMDEPTIPKSRSWSDDQVADYVRHVASITGKGPVGCLTKKWFNATDERGLGAHCVEPRWQDWNCSVGTRSAEDVKVKEKRFTEFEIRRKTQNVPNKKVNKALYINPSDQTTDLNNLIAEKKMQYQDLKEEFKGELRYTFPNASEERLQALAHRLLDEKLLADEKIRRFPIPHESFKPNLALTTADRRYKKWHHNGVWTWMESEQQFAWSDNLSYSKDDKGCEYETENPDSWVYHAGGSHGPYGARK